MVSTRVQQRLAAYRANSLLRKRYTVEHQNNNHVVVNGIPAIQFCSNDYLQVAQHPRVKKAFADGVTQNGLGSGASALVSGYSRAHFQLEQAFAHFLNREKALLFNSGYHANLGVLTAFADRRSTIIADKLCHASLIDGTLLSRAKYYRYRHHDIQHASQLLEKSKASDTLLVSESIFSIQGDITDVRALAALAKKHHSLLIIDDAHGIGVLGQQGGGISEHQQLSQEDVPCLITPLGKAFGSMGAIVSGSESLIQALMQFARTYRYSTALTPAVCHATLTVLTLIKTESWRRQTLQHLIQFFIREARNRELRLFSEDISPIKSIVIGANEKTIFLQEQLLNQGFFVSCIRPPTVANNEACLRISLNCAHDENQILQLLDCIKERADNYEQLRTNQKTF